MISINKRIKITKENTKVEFDLGKSLPEGEYDIHLLIDDKDKLKKREDYSLENWYQNGVTLEDAIPLSRQDLYTSNGR